MSLAKRRGGCAPARRDRERLLARHRLPVRPRRLACGRRCDQRPRRDAATKGIVRSPGGTRVPKPWRRVQIRGARSGKPPTSRAASSSSLPTRGHCGDDVGNGGPADPDELITVAEVAATLKLDEHAVPAHAGSVRTACDDCVRAISEGKVQSWSCYRRSTGKRQQLDPLDLGALSAAGTGRLSRIALILALLRSHAGLVDLLRLVVCPLPLSE